MKSVIILGAGQMGGAAAELLNPNETNLIGFGDNDSSKWADSGTPVMSVKEAIDLKPDAFLVSVLGDDRASDLANQVRHYGFQGEIKYLKDFYEAFDIRNRCVKYIVQRIKKNGIPGDIAELGVYKGDTARQLNALMPERTLYLFDTFKGFDDRDISVERERFYSKAEAGDFSDTSIDAVKKRLPLVEKAVFKEGFFPETTKELEGNRYAFVSMDADLYEPTFAGLRYFYPRLNSGGAIVLHDYNNEQFKGVKQAVNKFEQKYDSLNIVPLGDLHGSCVITK